MSFRYGQQLTRNRLKRVGLILLFCAFAFVARTIYVQVREQADLLMIIDQVHTMTVGLKLYDEEHHGEFPLSLPEMASNLNFDARLLKPFAGETIQYFRPKTNDPGDSVVIRVLFKSHLIEVNKDLERTEKVARVKR